MDSWISSQSGTDGYDKIVRSLIRSHASTPMVAHALPLPPQAGASNGQGRAPLTHTRTHERAQRRLTFTHFTRYLTLQRHSVNSTSHVYGFIQFEWLPLGLLGRLIRPLAQRGCRGPTGPPGRIRRTRQRIFPRYSQIHYPLNGPFYPHSRYFARGGPDLPARLTLPDTADPRWASREGACVHIRAGGDTAEDIRSFQGRFFVPVPRSEGGIVRGGARC